MFESKTTRGPDVAGVEVGHQTLISGEGKRVVGQGPGATALAHGSTGAGNDQVRFDVAFAALAPGLTVRTPIRELALSRAQEIEWLEGKGVTFPAKTAIYSVNEGMWGTSIGGRETLNPWDALPEAAWPGGPVEAGLPLQELVVSFTEGVPSALDG